MASSPRELKGLRCAPAAGGPPRGPGRRSRCGSRRAGRSVRHAHLFARAVDSRSLGRRDVFPSAGSDETSQDLVVHFGLGKALEVDLRILPYAKCKASTERTVRLPADRRIAYDVTAGTLTFLPERATRYRAGFGVSAPEQGRTRLSGDAGADAGTPSSEPSSQNVVRVTVLAVNGTPMANTSVVFHAPDGAPVATLVTNA
jgi:hypothetical protein